MYKYLMGWSKNKARSILVVPGGRMRSDGRELKYSKFHLNTRKKNFTVRVVKQWNRLPSEVIDSSVFQDIQTQLDTVLSNLLSLTLL